MASLYLLIPLAVIFVMIGVALFFWAVDHGQFDDLDGPAHSILFDNEPNRPKVTEKKQNNPPLRNDDH